MSVPKARISRTASGTPFWVTGEGPTLVLIHGVMLDHRMWAPQVCALSRSLRVCVIDMLGHGEAPDPPGERTLDDFVEQIDEVIDLVSENARPVLGGFSMGGLIAQAYAVRHHHKIGGVVLMNTVHDRSREEQDRVMQRYRANVAEGVDNAVASGLRRWFRDHEREHHAELMRQTEAWMRSGDFVAKLKAHRVFVSSDHEVTGKLGAISCPALVMTGSDDAGSTPDMARKMAAALPDSQLHILEGQHHMMPSIAADHVNGLLVAFVEHVFAD